MNRRIQDLSTEDLLADLFCVSGKKLYREKSCIGKKAVSGKSCIGQKLYQIKRYIGKQIKEFLTEEKKT